MMLDLVGKSFPFLFTNPSLFDNFRQRESDMGSVGRR